MEIKGKESGMTRVRLLRPRKAEILSLLGEIEIQLRTK